MPVPPVQEANLGSLVFSDLRHYYSGRPSWPRVLANCITNPGLIAALILRVQQRAYARGWRRFARVLRTVGVILVGAEFNPGARIGPGIYLPHPVGVIIGGGVVIHEGVAIGQGVTLGVREPQIVPRPQAMPEICTGAIISARSTVGGGIRIGAHALVGANSLVLEDVPDHGVVLGVPAKLLRINGSGATEELDHPDA